MPESNFTITQGTLTIGEMGNSVPYSGKLDDLSEHPVREIINMVMKNDAKKAFDNAAYAQFNQTQLVVCASGGTSTSAVSLSTNGTASSTCSVALQKGHVKSIVDTMKERNINPYMGDDYYAIAHPSTLRSFKNDLEDVKKYTIEGLGMIMNGEVGKYENTRFVEQTNVAKSGYTYTDWCFFFGQDTVAEAVACPEEIRGKIPTDYGRSKGIAWYYLGGFGIVHTALTQTRIFKWSSLA